MMRLIEIEMPVEAPLKWAGGKRWLVPKLREIMPKHERLVEPFMGSLSVSLGIRPNRAALNDINPHLVNFYRQIQSGLVMDISYGHSEIDYYKAREEFNNNIKAGIIDNQRMAMLFYYLNRTGFNGLCRFNKSGLFNVPFGRYSKINYRKDFNDIKSAIEKYSIHNGDFSTLEYLDGDLIYADPPYDATFSSYSSGGFGWDDQVRLAEFLSSLELPVIVSNQATPRIIELYSGLGFNIQEISAPRRISSSGDRSDALEVLAVKI